MEALKARVAGPLCQFSDGTIVDSDGEFFDGDTFFGFDPDERAPMRPVYYHHGAGAIGATVIGRGKLSLRKDCVWIDAELDLANPAAKAVAELAADGHIGWSSGAAAHLVRRERSGAGFRLTSWPVAEASLTPSPADFRCDARRVKSLFETCLARVEARDRVERLTGLATKAYRIDVAAAKAAPVEIGPDFAPEAFKLDVLRRRKRYLVEVERLRRAGKLGPGAVKCFAATLEDLLAYREATKAARDIDGAIRRAELAALRERGRAARARLEA